MKTRTLTFKNWSIFKQVEERLKKLYNAVVRKLSYNGHKIVATFYYN